ncbi:hypothetical protein FDA94_00845 [Herbidospora galbida]|uniref:KAP NTPase domain-containing protein n=1 Tax=Herbidospora galbida TaxID=2575442 RepID=A0A4U3MP64_9ACTN|nr:hypothetical protein [Herbidospora galbida]TKK91385.1 hypothetical protein FDA94_00845 [Herbidospora galbida]
MYAKAVVAVVSAVFRYVDPNRETPVSSSPLDPMSRLEVRRLIGRVLRDPETEKLHANFGGDLTRLRATAISEMPLILQNCPEEYEAYEEEWQRMDKVAAELSRTLSLRLIAPVGIGYGVIAVIAGYFWVGIYILAAAAFLIVPLISATWYRVSQGRKPGIRRLSNSLKVVLRDLRAFGVTRHALVAVVRDRDLVTLYVRYLVNEARRDRLTQKFAVTSIRGLSEIHDLAHHVPTLAQRDLYSLLRNLKGASVGIAGPRGVGKSSLVRARCRAGLRGSDIACLVAAPVDYAPREFVLHLFATLCRSVLTYSRRPRYVWSIVSYVSRVSLTVGGIALLIILVLVYDPHPWITAGVCGVLGVIETALVVALFHDVVIRLRPERLRRRLRKAARRNISRIRYLQTLSWTTSQTYKPALGGTIGLGADLMKARGFSKAEQPLTYPELVGEFRLFARRAAVLANYWRGRLIIGVDELDKIGTAAQAEKFINEIKTVFGIPNAYFFVTVSDDALTAFERRGLQVRDAFDSAFDEIVQVRPLTYEESRRLLYQRVVGLNEPYVALCHVLSGGLPRELIRAARHLVTVAEKTDRMAPVVHRCVRDDLRRKADALAQLPQAREDAELLLSLRTMSDDRELPDLVGEIGLACPQTAELRREFMTCVYFAHTVEEIFGDELDAAAVGESGPKFDALAQARAALAVNTEYAWRLISDCRASWGRSTLHLPSLS